VQASWDHTVDEHRSAQRDAIAAAAWTLAQEHGPLAVTMSQVAAAARVSRPTLYKYFPDVESMLTAHHRTIVEAHVAELAAIVNGPDGPGEHLARLVLAYAEICHHRARHSGTEMSRLVHSPFELDAAESQLVELFAQAIAEAEGARGELTPAALAAYAVRALATAADVPPSRVPAVARLVLQALTGDGAPSARQASA
jgi:AcrR family transcriptional regulator